MSNALLPLYFTIGARRLQRVEVASRVKRGAPSARALFDFAATLRDIPTSMTTTGSENQETIPPNEHRSTHIRHD
jgi:hypothetical protein